MSRRSAQVLLELLKSQSVVEFRDILRALDGASSSTAFRYLQQVPYRSSYNYNGRYYTLYEPSHYDGYGLLHHGDIYFSRDGTLKATVKRLIQESETGFTQHELQELLRVRVQAFLPVLVKAREVERERWGGLYHYFHATPELGQVQRHCRIHRIEAAKESDVEIDDTMIIRVLLVLIRYPGSLSDQVVRHLRGYSPPIVLKQVDAVFARYDIGEKGGPTIF
ncbi:MAG: hypothetical protein GY807_18800 [Gammaproteobacteria bacterium]|nr:hypothetical protein [Gammaproteobacteria bacterium]